MEETHYTDAQQQALRLFVILSRCCNAVTEHTRLDIERHGLSGSEFAVLELLYHKGPLPLGALADRILITTGSMTYVIDHLVKKGLVQRVHCPNDRRVRYGDLTDAGRSVIAAIFSRPCRSNSACRRRTFFRRTGRGGCPAQENGIGGAVRPAFPQNPRTPIHRRNRRNPMTQIAIVFHSGYGHTQKVAESIAEGAKSVAGANVKTYPRCRGRSALGLFRRRRCHHLRLPDVHGQYVRPDENVRGFHEQNVDAADLERQNRGGLHQLRLAQRRQTEHAVSVCHSCRAAKHDLGGR